MRPSKDEWLLNVASLTAGRTTCLRRAVGAVLADAKGRILSTGYNGVARGQPHCNEAVNTPCDYKLIGRTPEGEAIEQPQRFELQHPHACPGAKAKSGTQLDGCHAIHAEQNALLQCKDVDLIDTCYVTCSPCVTCVKLLLNTACFRIVFLERYPHDDASRELWEKAGRRWVHAPLESLLQYGGRQ